jgi:hypothetical protein
MLALLSRLFCRLRFDGVRALRRENKRLRDEVERLNIQAAAVMTVALGWGMDDPLDRTSWAWSVCYDDVRDLRMRYDQLRNGPTASCENARLQSANAVKAQAANESSEERQQNEFEKEGKS